LHRRQHTQIVIVIFELEVAHGSCLELSDEIIYQLLQELQFVVPKVLSERVEKIQTM